MSDDETASTKVTLSVSPASVDEGADSTTITVTGTLDHAPRTSATSVTVAVGATADTAIEGTDYTAVADFTLTISAGQATGTATFSLAPTDDEVDEVDDETISISGTTTAAGLNVVSTALTIDDNETATQGTGRGVTVSPTGMTVSEGSSSSYTVVLDTEPTANVTVTISGTADTDLSLNKTSLTFTASNWETAQTVTVSAAEDADAEDDKATLAHAVSGGDYGTNSVTADDVAVTVDDDETASTKVTLSVSPASVDEDADETTVTVTGTLDAAPRTSDTSVTVSVGATTDSATEETDYATVANFTLTISAGQTTGTATFSLTPTDDDVDEADETLSLSGTTTGLDVVSTAVTIVEDDERGVTVSATTLTMSEGSTATYTVVLASQPMATVTVTPSVSGSADVTFSPASLSFTTENWDTAKTVTVTAAHDVDGKDDEATIAHAVSGGDYGTNSVTADDVAVTVDDDETASTTVTLSVNTASVDEDASATTITVTGTLDHAPRTSATTVTVAVGASGDAATEGTDYETVANFTLTISAGQTTGTVSFTLTPTDDDVDEADEALSVTGTTSVTGLGITGTTVTITDNDERGVAVSATTLTVPEGGTGAYTTVADLTLTVAAGQTSGTATFTLTPMDDAVDEEDETITVSGRTPGLTVDAAAVTIMNIDPLPQAWLARFGRNLADQVLEAVNNRMTASRREGTEGQLAGQSVGNSVPVPEWAGVGQGSLPPADWLRSDALGWHDEEGIDGQGAGSRAMTERELLEGSSFAVTRGSDETGYAAVWSEGAVSRFEGQEGGLPLDGEITTGMLGADWMQENWMAGLALSYTQAEGEWATSEFGDSGRIDASIIGFWPWGQIEIDDRISVWGLLGRGQGDISLTPTSGDRVTADMDLTVASAGLRRTVLAPEESGGFELSVTSDALAVWTNSESVRGMRSATTEVTRLRLGLEGIRPFDLDRGATLGPEFEIGLRLDGGDAETGLGSDFGAGIVWSDPGRGLQADVRGRGLLTHEDQGFRERSFAGSLAWHEEPGSQRGFKFSLNQTVGASATGGVEALLSRDTLEGLAANDNGSGDRHRLDAKLGYGFSAFGGRFVSTPEIGHGFLDSGREYSLGWRLGLVRRNQAFLELALEGTLRESTNDNVEPERGVRLGLKIGW